MQKSNIKYQSRRAGSGIPASRDTGLMKRSKQAAKRLRNFAFCTVIFDLSMAWKSLVISIGFGVVLIAGCGQKEAPSVKQSRAIAAENMELQKQLDRSHAQIENLKDQYDEELEKQQKLLEKCQQERDQLKAKSRQNVRDQVKSVLDSVMADNTRLREENAKLKAQIEEVQK